MWIITICIAANGLCFDRPHEGIYIEQGGCEARIVEARVIQRIHKKYPGRKFNVYCREMPVVKLTGDK